MPGRKTAAAYPPPRAAPAARAGRQMTAPDSRQQQQIVDHKIEEKQGVYVYDRHAIPPLRIAQQTLLYRPGRSKKVRSGTG